jgi:hypothetical protein
MNKLQEITIKVPVEIAEVYRQGTEAEKQQIKTKIAFFLQSTPISKSWAIKQLRQTMTKIGNKAIARGLTPQILEEILKETDVLIPTD